MWEDEVEEDWLSDFDVSDSSDEDRDDLGANPHFNCFYYCYVEALIKMVLKLNVMYF